ncbi:MAG: hypothetical protein JWP87_128 [Labilithrix sp.]|jgi:hypothetical protein|nr:hypothetical protein [Labilithrix sp.]
MRYVALEEARTATGMKLVVAASVPSPWSEAAKGILHVKGIEALLVRFSSTDTAIREWAARPCLASHRALPWTTRSGAR